MENPIEINNYEHNDLKAKLIVFNIIEYINNKYYDLNIGEIIFNNNYDFSYGWGWSDGFSSNMELGVSAHPEDVSIKYFEIEDFIKGYGISNIEIAKYIFIILHEIGHAKNNVYLYNKFDGNINRYRHIRRGIDSVISLGFGGEDLEYLYTYYFNPFEQIANIFAYQNFYEVWKMLESRNLI